jgi:hypothetical protein
MKKTVKKAKNTGERFVFEMTGLRIEADRLFFYIRPANGLALPDILKWMKQTTGVLDPTAAKKIKTS